MDYHHAHNSPCPVTGEIVTGHIFTDHARWKECGHPYNACSHCHKDQRTLSEALHALNDARAKEYQERERARWIKPYGA